MIKHTFLLIVLLFWLVTFLIVTGCTSNYETAETKTTYLPSTTTTPASELPSEVIPGQIRVYRIRVEALSIMFFGTAGLPDGTILQSSIYENDTKLEWWPEELEILVKDSQWTVLVAFSENETHQRIRVGPIYHFEIWQKDAASILARFTFDLVGPQQLKENRDE